jgi:hypothetical protein
MKGTNTMRTNNLVTKFILVSFALLMASLASAQSTSAPNVMMLPTGTAQTCETPAGAQTPDCSSFVPGNEPFLLLIKATNNQTAKYTYTVIATLQDGTTRIITGQVGRADDNAGYTATSVTLGCEPVSVDTTINEAN